jgi:hypothetical protein
MHKIKLRVLHKVYKQVFRQLYLTLCQNLQKQELILTRDHKVITSK